MPNEFEMYSELWEILGDRLEQFLEEMEDYKEYCARKLLGMEE